MIFFFFFFEGLYFQEKIEMKLKVSELKMKNNNKS